MNAVKILLLDGTFNNPAVISHISELFRTTVRFRTCVKCARGFWHDRTFHSIFATIVIIAVHVFLAAEV
jgi:hypothetical protein